jgi:hypothetical protein
MSDTQGMRIVLVFVAALIGCRDAASPSEPPATGTTEREQALDAPAPATSEPSPDPSPTPEPVGAPIGREQVVETFQRWWTPWSLERLATHPLRAQLDALVAAGATLTSDSCDRLAAHIDERAPSGSPELLFGDTARLREGAETCWWLHHDGMMGPGLGAALASDGQVWVVWIVSEG